MSAVCLIIGKTIWLRGSAKKNWSTVRPLINDRFFKHFQFRAGGAWEVLHQNHLPWRATLHQVNVTRFYNHFMNPNRLILVGPFTEEYVMFSQWSFSFQKSGSFPETKISYFQLLWSILKAILSEGCQSEFPTLTFLLQILHLL